MSLDNVMTTSKRYVKFLSLIFSLKCLSKFYVIRILNRKNLKTRAFRFGEGGKHFENGAFRKRWRQDLPDRVLFKHKSKMAGDCCLFKFLPPSADGTV